MAERIFATGNVKNRIQDELKAYRETPDYYIKASHPLVSFITLDALAPNPQCSPRLTAIAH